MERLLALLNEIKDDVDFTTETRLIDDGVLDSLNVLQVITSINDTFDIEIPATEIIPENFNSAEAIWNMIQRLS